MKFSLGLTEALDKRHPLRRLAVRDAFAFGVLAAVTLGLFGATELYYIAYSKYRASLGLPTDASPVITLPAVRRR